MGANYILIAEDDADDRFLLETAFAEKGFEEKLTFVENGVELLEFLKSRHLNDKENEGSLPCFILLDLNMPKKDGREVLKEIKEDLEKLKKIADAEKLFEESDVALGKHIHNEAYAEAH